VRSSTATARWKRLLQLTERDREVCGLLFEQRVMTTAQLTAVAYGGSVEVARHRLVVLQRLDVVSRFRPVMLRGEGSAPFHYVLGPAGAELLAAVRGTTVRRLGYRLEEMVGLAHSPRLGHIVGINDVLASLVEAARRRGARLASWYSERRCAEQWGDVVRPDACGLWREGGHGGYFFLEYDRGTETTRRLAEKVAEYARLARRSGLVTPVLVWLPSARREDEVRRTLAAVRTLDVPVLTGCRELGVGPADAAWLPLDRERRVPLRCVVDLYSEERRLEWMRRASGAASGPDVDEGGGSTAL
jgi:hypothetical protein